VTNGASLRNSAIRYTCCFILLHLHLALERAEATSMAETSNIAKMAEKLSSELFSEFLWDRIGPMNSNWQCVEEHPNKKTHPSDVVFFYDNPYAASRTYVDCDLKSYAKGTISAGVVNSGVANLSAALACAELSPEWQAKYVHEHVSAEVCGLLFVYNHDGEYDKDFQKLLKEVKQETLDIPRRSKVVVGPSDIFWLNNVRYESCKCERLTPFHPNSIATSSTRI
jgi:hypothetical protein